MMVLKLTHVSKMGHGNGLFVLLAGTNLQKIEINTMLADGLTPQSARPSACTAMANLRKYDTGTCSHAIYACWDISHLPVSMLFADELVTFWQRLSATIMIT